MFQNSLVSIGLVVIVVGSLVGYILFIQWKNRKKSNKINLMEYQDEKDEIKGNFMRLSKSDRIKLFNERVKSSNDSDK